VAVAVGGLIYWVVETAALATHVMAIMQIAVWLSPISILGWLALAALIAAAFLLTGRLPGLRR
jgi:cytosine/uracil/thiamine/allantoin permease